MRPNLRQLDEAIDLAQEVIVRDMTLKAESRRVGSMNGQEERESGRSVICYEM
jgi:hypothetical protein